MDSAQGGPHADRRVAVESVAEQHTVYEIQDAGHVIPQPTLDAQQEMTKQIAQLWDTYTNFQGLEDIDDSYSSSSSPPSESDAEERPSSLAEEKTEAKEKEKPGEGEMDALAVRALVNERFLHAQSEIMVALDVVQLLLAAEKQAFNQALQGSSSSTPGVLKKHDQPGAPGSIGAAESKPAAGGEPNMPLPVGVLGTTRTEKPRMQEQQKVDRMKFVLGAKQQQLSDAASTLELGAERLARVAKNEAVFWRTAFELRRRNWVVQQHRQLLQVRGNRRLALPGDRYFIRYGYADAGSTFSEDGVAELVRAGDEEENEENEENEEKEEKVEAREEAMDVDDEEHARDFGGVPLVLSRNDGRTLRVRLFSTRRQPQGAAAEFTSSKEDGRGRDASSLTLLDRAHARLLHARKAMFDHELYYRLCKEARVLELGSVRSIVAPQADGKGQMHDVLMVTLSRDNVAVRFEWMLGDDSEEERKEAGDAENSTPAAFAQWQSEYYSGLALVMAAMYQRRLHREVKQYYLGDGLSSKSLVPATGSSGQIPDPFVVVPSVSPQGQTNGQAAANAAAGSSSAAAGAQGAASGSGSAAAGSGSGTPSAAGPAPSTGTSQADGGHSSTTFAVAKPELLVLAPVLQNVQFARWQHILSVNTQRACAAWRCLVEEPIEVISHFGRTYPTPSGARQGGKMTEREMDEWRQFSSGRRNALDTDGLPFAEMSCDGMAYVVRMRFLGGTVMAFRVDTHGNLLFAKGYFPPPAPPNATIECVTDCVGDAAASHKQAGDAEGGMVMGSRPSQIYINRVFRIVPLSGIAEFVDQLRRELQSLALLRVAAALSRCSYQREGKRCQMGQWYVHQSQLCVVGEWWEGTRHRQVIGVAKWSTKDGADGGDGELVEEHAAGEWDLSLYFGPKHPTVFDVPQELAKMAPRIPWVTCFPLPKGHRMAAQVARAKTFEEKLFRVLIATI
ncbi:hypothetical protein GQ54DRAFT_296736 [Martensiomyces pterosporus]|nr:hypothetical protein GQ54DRAFT_296736 [Martensiomyces pterosporus]